MLLSYFRLQGKSWKILSLPSAQIPWMHPLPSVLVVSGTTQVEGNAGDRAGSIPLGIAAVGVAVEAPDAPQWLLTGQGRTRRDQSSPWLCRDWDAVMMPGY